MHTSNPNQKFLFCNFCPQTLESRKSMVHRRVRTYSHQAKAVAKAKKTTTNIEENFRFRFHSVWTQLKRLNWTCFFDTISLLGKTRGKNSTRVGHLDYQTIITVRNEVAKVMFLQACVCPRGGGSTWPGTPPGPGTPPWDQVHPPRTRYTPLGPGTPPQTRCTYPPDQVHPPGTRYTSWDQVHPHRPGKPPRTRYTPPWTRYPPGPGTPPPPEIRPLLRTVRILLECILVTFWI